MCIYISVYLYDDRGAADKTEANAGLPCAG